MRFVKLALVLSVGLLLASTATAQPGGGFGQNLGLANFISFNQGLQDELKVSKEQAEKLTTALNKVREDLREDTAKLRERGLAQEDRDKINKKVNDANAKAVESVLKPEQVKRLKQIENQQGGLGIFSVFSKEEAKTALKLTDKQDEEIKDISKDLQKDMREIGGGRGGFGAFDPESQKKRADLQKEALAAATKLLNDKQKTTLKDLIGEPYTLVFAPGGFGPGGGGGFGPGFGPGGGGQPGTILSTRTQDQLKLTDEQKKKLEELQKDLDSKLEKLLTEEQMKQLKDMRGGPRAPQ
jgi:Spy/CpxP family protein refolding chaperone